MEAYVSANKLAVDRACTLQIVQVGPNSFLQNTCLHPNCFLAHTVPWTSLTMFFESEECRKIEVCVLNNAGAPVLCCSGPVYFINQDVAKGTDWELKAQTGIR